MINKVITLALVLTLHFSATLYAAQVQLPRSGQTTCYSASGTVIPCAGTGQAGETQQGAAWPDPRFTNPDGTAPVNGDVVADQLTGLMWSRNANLAAGLKSWQEALDYIALMNAGNTFGYSDWRLPNIDELMSLVDLSQKNPALPINHPFMSVVITPPVDGYSFTPYAYYWSSTTLVSNPSSAWTVCMADGKITANTANDWSGGPKQANIVRIQTLFWPVRGGM
jgi:hypothetical protein